MSGADAANALKEENDVVFVTFGEDTTVFLAAADSYDAAVFAVLDAEAAAALDVQSGAQIYHITKIILKKKMAIPDWSKKKLLKSDF